MSEETNAPSPVADSVAHASRQRQIQKIKKIALVTAATAGVVTVTAFVVVKLNGADKLPSLDTEPPFDL